MVKNKKDTLDLLVTCHAIVCKTAECIYQKMIRVSYFYRAIAIPIRERVQSLAWLSPLGVKGVVYSDREEKGTNMS